MPGDEQLAPKKQAAAPKKKTARKKAVRKKAVAKEPAATEAEQGSVAAGFDLGEVLTIVEVAEMHQQLIQLLDAGGGVELNAADTENIDGAGLQLLAAFIKDAKNRGVPVSWGKSSDVVREAAGQVGLTEALGLAQAE
jgi:anti-anti-sigma regulatory factor